MIGTETTYLTMAHAWNERNPEQYTNIVNPPLTDMERRAVAVGWVIKRFDTYDNICESIFIDKAERLCEKMTEDEFEQQFRELYQPIKGMFNWHYSSCCKTPTLKNVISRTIKHPHSSTANAFYKMLSKLDLSAREQQHLEKQYNLSM